MLFRLENFLFRIKKLFFFLQKSQIANGPAHLHPALIIIIINLGHVESILLAMGRVKSFYCFLFWKLNRNELQSSSN